MAAVVHRSGLEVWAMGVRNTMSNDPGRQSLEDDLKLNGFLFLENYLEGILAGPKREYVLSSFCHTTT